MRKIDATLEVVIKARICHYEWQIGDPEDHTEYTDILREDMQVLKEALATGALLAEYEQIVRDFFEINCSNIKEENMLEYFPGFSIPADAETAEEMAKEAVYHEDHGYDSFWAESGKYSYLRKGDIRNCNILILNK